MKRICLIIVFNHKYNRNIPILDKIYEKRFSSIYYLVPFATEEIHKADSPNIITVYETSYCFQGYFAQAYEKIKEDSFSHYIMIGDDQILNPKLNETNILAELGLGEKDSYIKNIIPYGESIGDQSNKLYNILSAFRINVGVSYQPEIPSYEEALEKCREHHLKVTAKLPLSFFCHKGYLHPKHLPLTLVTLAINRGRKLPYPLFKSYADMLVIDRNSMNEFCRLSGVFAAMNIFVETAIPLAMILACSNIKTENDILGYHGIENWGKEIPAFEDKYRHDLGYLLDNFEDKALYYHPIKLSRWTTQGGTK